MKPSRIFWAALFITVGLLGLLHNFSVLTLDWHVWRMTWPVILILIGGAVLLRNHPLRWITAAGAGLLTAILIFTFFVRAHDTVTQIGRSVQGIGTWDSSDRDVVEQSIIETWDDTTSRAMLSFEAGAGTFRIVDTCRHLVQVDTRTSLGGYELTRDVEGGMPRVKIEPKDGNVTIDDGHFVNTVDLRLHPDPVWDLDFDIGAATADLDLRPFRTGRVDLDAGAASITLTLGDRNATTDLRVGAGASGITVRVPRAAACEVRLETGLTHTDLEGFTKSGDGIWRASGEGKSPQKITMRFETGVSSVNIQRY